MEIKDNQVTVALDLSRAFKGNRNPIVISEFNKIITLGREVDLLETIRRQENPNQDFFTIQKKEIELYAAHIGIEPALLEAITLGKFISANLIELKDSNRVEIKIKTSQQIYDYAKNQIEKSFITKEKSVLRLISRGMIKPIVQEEFDETINQFPDYVQKTLTLYLDQTKIISPIQAKESIFWASPKIFKNKSVFCKLIDDDGNGEIAKALDFISNNPGIPSDSINPSDLKPSLISGLTMAGALDSVTLNIDGVPRRYIVPATLSNERIDKDHLDQIKKTLANFRFGERYSKWATLTSVPKFLESMVDRGFAGKATPVGTDYKNLELAGIVKVSKVLGDKYRFWMLKRDVIEDTLKVLKGAVPLIENNPSIRLHEMENSVMSRIIMSQSPSDDHQQIVDAIRKINRGLF